jgi:hypothetical protein
MASDDDALRDLLEERVDVVVLAGGQPMSRLERLQPDAGRYIRLLRLDPAAAETARARPAYRTGAVQAATHPNWLHNDVPSFTVPLMLVTREDGPRAPGSDLVPLLRALCSGGLARLAREGHPKWRSVSTTLPPLADSFEYHPVAVKELSRCGRTDRLPSAVRPADDDGSGCDVQSLLLGLCRRQ